MLTAVLWTLASLAWAQVPPPAEPVVQALRASAPLPVSVALERLRRDAPDDPGAAEVLAVLSDAPTRAALAARLAPIDADGSLRAALARLATDLSRARAAADSAAAQEFDGGRPSGGEPEGLSSKAEVNVGAMGVGRRLTPVFAVSGGFAYKKGPWDSDASAEGLVAPDGTGLPKVFTVNAGVSREIGRKGASVFLEAEGERDDLLGVRLARSVRIGAAQSLIESPRQTLTLAAAVGPNVEGKAAGTERFLSPAASIEYALRLDPVWSVIEKAEAEFNAAHAGDIEFKSVTGVVWKLSEKLSAQAVHTLKARTEPVPGYAGSRSSTTIGLHVDF